MKYRIVKTGSDPVRFQIEYKIWPLPTWFVSWVCDTPEEAKRVIEEWKNGPEVVWSD